MQKKEILYIFSKESGKKCIILLTYFLFTCSSLKALHANSSYISQEIANLEKSSFLYQSTKIIDTSKPVTLNYEYANPKGAIEKASVWLVCDCSYTKRELDTIKQIGINAFYYSPKIHFSHKEYTYIKNLDLYQDQESDFTLAIKKYQDYSRLYLLTEIEEKDWKYLPINPPYSVEKSTLISLRKKYPLLQDIESPYLATPPIPGVDRKFRRWIYPLNRKNNIALLNFFDPSFLANKLASGKILQAKQKGSILQLPKEKESLSLFETELLSKMIRKYGGYSFQRIDLPLKECRPYTFSGPDLIFHPFLCTAFIHGFITENTDLIESTFCTMIEDDIELKHFIHSQNKLNPLSYTGRYLNNLQLQSLLTDDLNALFEKESSFLKIRDKKIVTSSLGLCATKLGITDFKKNQKRLQKVHLLMSFFHAMQPGVFSLSIEDLRGTFYNYDKKTSGKLYPPIKNQLTDPDSYCSKLQEILRIRNLYQIDTATMLAVINSPEKGVLCYLLENSKKEKILIALNFSDKKISSIIKSDYLQDTYALDLFSENSYPKEYKQKNLIINLKRFEAKCLALKKKNSNLF